MKSKLVAATAIVMAVIVGGVALWSNNRAAEKAPEQQEATLKPETGSADVGTAPSSAQGDQATAGEQAVPVSGTAMTNDTTATTATTATSVPESHVVKPGETLRSIAEYYYHNKAYSGDIEAFNNLDDPDHIKPGDTLLLPKPETLSH